MEVLTEKEVEQVAKETVKNALENLDALDDEFDELNEINEETKDKTQMLIEEAKARQSRDIFEDVIDPLIKEGGVSPKVEVYKDNALIHSSKQRISWEWIHKNLCSRPQYGAGVYKVNARGEKGKWLGSETRELIPLPKEEVEKINNNPNNLNMDSILDYMSRSQERAEQRTERLIRELKDSQSEKEEKNMNMLATILASQANKNDNSDLIALMMKSSENLVNVLASQQNNNKGEDTRLIMEMMMKSQENMMNVQREMQQSTMSMIKELDEKNQKSIADLRDMMFAQFNQPKDNDLDPMQMFETMKNAESAGFEMAKTMFELADAKAEEKAQEKTKGDNNSLTDTVIKAVGTIAPMLAGQMTSQPKQPAPTTNPVEASRRQLSQPQTNNPQTKTRKSYLPTKSSTIKSSSIPTATARPVDNTPETTTPENQTVNTVEQTIVVESAKQTMLSEDEKKLIFEKAIPIITECLLSETPADEAVILTLDELSNYLDRQKFHFISEFFTQEFIFETAEKSGIMNIAREQGREFEIKEWLSSYYDNLKQETRQ